MSAQKYLKILKEKERILMDIEKKLVEQLNNLKKEEIYLETSIMEEKSEDYVAESMENEEEEASLELDDDTINQAPLEHLSAASSSFYNMYTGGNPSVKVDMVLESEEEEEDEEEEEEEEGDDDDDIYYDDDDVSNRKRSKLTEDEQAAEFKRLMNSMHGDG